MRVLVVGAGPTGLSAAVEMKRRGIEALVIDRRDALSTFSRAVGITPRSLHLLEASGVTERLLAEGMRFRQAKYYLGNRLAATVPLSVKAPQYGYDFIIGLAQDRTEFALASAFEALGGTIHYKTELTGFHEEGDEVSVETSGDVPGAFDYVVGADGIGSTVRQLAGISYPGYDLPEDWAIADVDVEGWPDADAFTLCKLPRGEVSVVAPLELGRVRVISNTPDALITLPLPLNVTNIRRAGTFRISVRQVTSYHKGRIFLAGDAAHCHSPVGGRGMNLGIADGAELARCLAAGTPDAYGPARHGDAAQVLMASERGRRAITSGIPLLGGAIGAALSIGSKVPFLQQQIARQVLYG